MKGALGVLILLIGIHSAKVKEIAEKLECSERMISRYIQELNYSGCAVNYENHLVVLKSFSIVKKVINVKDIDMLKICVCRNDFEEKTVRELLHKLETRFYDATTKYIT